MRQVYYCQNKAIRRTQEVLCLTGNRLERLEDSLAKDPARIDLFTSTINALASDEDDRKVSFYAAFLDRIVNGEPEGTLRLRLIGDFFKSAAFEELNHFATFKDNGSSLGSLPSHLDIRFLPMLQQFGLYNSSPAAVYGDRITPLGKVAREIALSGKKESQ